MIGGYIRGCFYTRSPGLVVVRTDRVPAVVVHGRADAGDTLETFARWARGVARVLECSVELRVRDN